MWHLYTILTAWTEAPSHYLNQHWTIVSWTLRYKLQWNFNQNTKLDWIFMSISFLGTWNSFLVSFTFNVHDAFCWVPLTINQHRFRRWLGVEHAPNHCINKWWSRPAVNLSMYNRSLGPSVLIYQYVYNLFWDISHLFLCPYVMYVWLFPLPHTLWYGLTR